MLFDIYSPLTPAFGGKKHWLLNVEDCTDFAWSYFLKEKLYLKNVVLAFIKESTAMCSISMMYARCDNAGKKLKGFVNRKG